MSHYGEYVQTTSTAQQSAQGDGAKPVEPIACRLTKSIKNLFQKPTKQIVDYKIVSQDAWYDSGKEKLITQVKQLMVEGWQPLGPMTFGCSAGPLLKWNRFHQTMVKYSYST
jgi:hypothetical protein